MLDTDTVSFALRGQGRVAEAILRHKPSELCVSAITVAELRYGADLNHSAKLHLLIDTFVAEIAVMPFDGVCAASFGKIAADLANRGAPIGDFDVLIGAHASALQAVLVTNNTKHFERVRSLRLENWYS
jgi:tRNA(fMet)-specific endonuclease VapC